MERMEEKTKVYTALLLTIFFGSLLIMFGVNPSPACIPPRGKVVKVGIFCQETRMPVPDGFAVTFTRIGGITETKYTVGGYVQFGDGTIGNWVVSGNYSIKFYWNTEFEYNVTIDCSQETWQFNY